jgi:CDP-diglyceride synthetase
MNEPKPEEMGDFITALVIVPTLHVLFIFSAFIIPFFWMLVLNIAISQFLYLIPLMLAYRRRGQLGAVKGILVAAFLTILLNGACSTVITPAEHPWASSVRNETIMTMALSLFILIMMAFYGLKTRSRPK